MLQFLKYVLATITGLVAFLLLIVFFFIALAISAGSSSDKTASTKPNSILKIDLNKPIVEYAPEDPFNGFGSAFSDVPQALGLVQLKNALKKAKTDPNIKGIFLQSEYPMGSGWATLEEVRNALADFQKSGKFVYAYGEVYSDAGYYVSSVANRIYLNPAGGMEFNGLKAEYMFYKGLLDKIGIEPVIFKVGDFKSATEVFTRTNMSDASRLQTTELLANLHGHIYQKIADSRKISVATLNTIADSLKADTPQKALKSQLVTHLSYWDEFEADIRKTVGLAHEKKIEYVGVMNYLKTDSEDSDLDLSTNKIAVIVGEGDIVTGNGGDGMIGSDKIMAELRKAREDKNVKAVVLRVNSGGGSSLASDLMWREVQLTKKVKPVIGSMADYAASGGYYMLMACDSIVAQPTTITGSIGIFATLFNSEKLMKDKLGLSTDGVETHPHADYPSVTHAMSDFEKAKLQAGVNAGYETFTKKAAEGRHMTVEDLKAIASGRVWSGMEAKKNGLIDRFGGIDDAIALAAKVAKLKKDDYRVVYQPEPKNFFDELFSKAGDEAESRILKAHLGSLAPYMKHVERLNRMQGIQARMPAELIIQ